MLAKIIKAFPRAIRNPVQSAKLARTRLFPYGLTSKDKASLRITSWCHGEIKREPAENVLSNLSGINITLNNVFERTLDLSIDPYELVILLSIVKSVKAKKILEIGTWDGNTALNLAANIDPDGEIYTMDLPKDSDSSVSLNIPSILNNTTDRKKVGQQYLGTPFEKKINQVFHDSATFDWTTLGIDFDLVFIDGCHAYNYVRSDTLNALRVLKAGGTIVWHDYGMIEDVSKYVDKLNDYLEIRVISNTRIAIMRSKPSKLDLNAFP